MEKLHELLNLSSIQVKIIEYTLMIICQICQSWFRAWNIKAIASYNKLYAHISWQLYGWVWIIGTGLGLKAIADFDWIGMIIFFTAGAVGLEIGMRQKKEK